MDSQSRPSYRPSPVGAEAPLTNDTTREKQTRQLTLAATNTQQQEKARCLRVDVLNVPLAQTQLVESQTLSHLLHLDTLEHAGEQHKSVSSANIRSRAPARDWLCIRGAGSMCAD